MTMLDTASEMSYKAYIIVGFFTGTVSSALSGHLDDAILTFVLGLLSALGAAFGKFLINCIKQQTIDRKDRNALWKRLGGLKEFRDEDKAAEKAVKDKDKNA